MTLDLYVIKHGKNLRCGYTTGSCATAAAKAATLMLDTGKKLRYVEIDTPAGIRLKLEVHDIEIGHSYVSCAIIKDGGDDPDSTDGMKIHAKVSKRTDNIINIEGGQGIGRIVRKGLFGQVGDAAINPVPRQMIKKELGELGTGYDVMIYAPEGEVRGKKTFNSNIGIEGGISIIGTKGIVYPMSDDALIKTIYMEIDALAEEYGKDELVLVPGGYGEKIAKDLGYSTPPIKMSNYIGDALLYAYNKGFKSINLLGHIGKFAKLSIGVFNTHSKVCDGRMEAFVYYLSLRGAEIELINKINFCLTAEEGINICLEEGHGQIIRDMEKGAQERIKRYLKDDELDIKVIIYSMERGVDFC